MHTYILGSSPLVFAPGMIEWAINGYAFKKDRKVLANIIHQGWNLPLDVCHKVLAKEIPYIVREEQVIINVG
jgi:hypothetical protein